MPQLAITYEEIIACHPVLSQLRPELSHAQLLEYYEQMKLEGFKLAYLTHQQDVVAVAGFRILTNLAKGKYLYLDDLVTLDSVRSQGHGETLLNWLIEHAKSQGCKAFSLDSSTKRHRAHKFYFKQGFHIQGYHFTQKLKD